MAKKDKKSQGIDWVNDRLAQIFSPKICLGIVILFITCYVILFSSICIKKYFSFTYHDWDFGIYVNMMWNLIHGNANSSLLGHHFLYDHASMIAYLIALPYFIFRHPIFMLIMQSFVLGFSVFPVYLLAREKIDCLSGAMIVLMYLMYPPIHYANLYEFNFETFSLPFLSFAFYFLLKNRKILFFLMCIGACACKENIPLTIIALGLFGLLRPHRRILGLAAIVLGMSWFYFDLQILPSLVTKKAMGTISTFGVAPKNIGLFAQYGNNLKEIFTYFLLHPLVIIKTAFLNGLKGNFFYGILGVLLYLPLLRPDVLLINLPHAMTRLLALNRNEYTIYYHSASPVAPFVFFALVFSVITLFKKMPGLLKYRYGLLTSVFVVELISMVHIWDIRPPLARFVTYDKSDAIRMSFVKEIPSHQGSVASSFEFLPHLASREHIYSTHAFFGTVWWKGPKPKDLDYILMDFKSPLMTAMFFESPALFDRNLYSYLSENKFGLVKARGDIVLFKKNYETENKILSVLSSPDNLPASYSFKVDNNLALLKYDYKMLAEDHGILQFTFYWHAENNITSDYVILFFINQGDYDVVSARHILGYALLPPSMWNKGDIVVENYWLILPQLYPGQHTVSVEFMDINNRKIAQVASPDKESIDRYGKYKLVKLTQ